MTELKQHQSHKDVLLRLKKAHGHLAKVIQMIQEEEGCLKISQQLFAVEKAITQAKKNVIHDHIEHCLEDNYSKKSKEKDLKEFKEITKYL
ncbi:MAG: metal-sensing transcriptional repressor [Bacteriovorax sp.]|nr:metal-sensing transcriptional repressor [Bacteriovorax sp.]